MGKELIDLGNGLHLDPEKADVVGISDRLFEGVWYARNKHLALKSDAGVVSLCIGRKVEDRIRAAVRPDSVAGRLALGELVDLVAIESPSRAPAGWPKRIYAAMESYGDVHAVVLVHDESRLLAMAPRSRKIAEAAESAVILIAELGYEEER